MANKNNNTNELVCESDDPTCELEELTLQHALAGTPNSADSEEEDTYDIARIPGKDGGEHQDAGHHAQSTEISRLQFDIEQQRSRLSGLESELRAREEITSELNQRIADLEDDAASSAELLRQREVTIDELKAENRTRATELSRTEAAREEIISELNQRIADLEDDSKSSAEFLRQQEATIDELKTENRTRATELTRTEAARAALLGDKECLNSELAAVKDELNRLAAELKGNTGEPAQQDPRATESASGSADIAAQLRRTEAYADEVRRRLADKAEEAEWLEKDLQHTRMELHDKTAMVTELEGSLRSTIEENDAMAEELAAMQELHNQATAKLRSSLSDAQDELSRSALINEQLASDLEESRAYRERMESMLNQSDDDFTNRVEELETRLSATLAEKRGLEEQLASHNDAVNSLIDNLEIHEDSFEPVEPDFPESAVPRDRMNRMLVGRIGEQELRFPLFKNRLTIGRTQQNDIQLNVPFISRRHAVVITEGSAARVIDWGSRNGVFVNSNRITEHFLKSGDRITIGNANFRYEERPRRDN
jgi:chromosome segregation ATPase